MFGWIKQNTEMILELVSGMVLLIGLILLLADRPMLGEVLIGTGLAIYGMGFKNPVLRYGLIVIGATFVITSVIVIGSRG